MPANHEPQVNVQLISADIKPPLSALETVIIAPGRSGGSYINGALYEDINNEIDAGKKLAGTSSLGHLMIDAFKSLNKESRLHAIIVDDKNDGTPAAGTITFTATPTESASLFVTIGSFFKNRYELAITIDSTATTIGNDLAAKINADPNSAVSASNSAGVVTITARNDGAEGNKISIVIDGSVAGVSFAIVAMAGGTNDNTPDVIIALDQLLEKKIDIVAPIAYLTQIKNHLDGQGILCKTDSYANFVTLLAPNSLASQNITLFCDKTNSDSNYKGSSVLELDCVKSTQFAALRALRSVDNALIGDFMEAGNSRGGANVFGLPYFNMKMLNSPVIRTGKGFKSEEINNLKKLGGSTFSNSGDGTILKTNDVKVTIYKEANPTALGLTYPNLSKKDTWSFVKRYFFETSKEKFAQCKLTDGEATSNKKEVIHNQKTIKSFVKDIYKLLSGPDYKLLESGSKAEAKFDAGLVVLVDVAQNKADIFISSEAIGQLGELNYTIQPQY